MGEIYSVADRTVIYLGELTPNMSEIFTAAAAAATRKSRTLISGPKKNISLRVILDASREIMSRPWFTRVWVIQELIFSKEPWVQFQDKRMRWRAFCQLLLGEPHNSREVEKYLRVLREMDSNRSEEGRFTLFEALKARRGLRATDARDLVYANLSIIKDLDIVSKYIQIDYGKPVSWTFSQVGAYVCRSLGFQTLISYTEDIMVEQRLEGLPSWVPDWSQFTIDTARPFRNAEVNILRKKGFDNVSFWNKNIPLVLGHIGYEFDVVKSVSGVIPHAYDLDAVDAQNYRNLTLRLSETKNDKRWKYNLYCEDTVRSNVGSIAYTRTKNYLSFMQTTWAHLFNALEHHSSDRASEKNEFIAAFSRWAWTSSTRKPGNPNHEGLGVGYHVEEYFDTRNSESPLSGRRLAMTQSGLCIIVPARARKGDVISGFLNVTLPVVLRVVDNPQDLKVEDIIIEEGRQSWKYTVLKAVEHYSVIGNCYVTPSEMKWARTSLEDLRLFALH